LFSANLDRSNLYLKLFKLVFGSVSLFAADNEQMLKPHLHTIVNRSMELALSAKEPYNYFLLLRALFRSIGGGSHDQLYQEFLPLLPNLLQGKSKKTFSSWHLLLMFRFKYIIIQLPFSRNGMDNIGCTTVHC
jgi:hypothetical protein